MDVMMGDSPLPRSVESRSSLPMTIGAIGMAIVTGVVGYLAGSSHAQPRSSHLLQVISAAGPEWIAANATCQGKHPDGVWLLTSAEFCENATFSAIATFLTDAHQ